MTPYTQSEIDAAVARAAKLKTMYGPKDTIIATLATDILALADLTRDGLRYRAALEEATTLEKYWRREGQYLNVAEATADEATVEYATKANEAADTIAALRARVAELEGLVYVPGLRRCAKCGLNYIHTALDAGSGRVAAINEPEPCPNGCGPTWPVTERQAGNEAIDRAEALTDQVNDISTERDTAKQQLAWALKQHDAHITTLTADRNRMREALEECKAVFTSSEWKGLWGYLLAHDYKWTGPTAPLEKIEAALSATKPEQAAELAREMQAAEESAGLEPPQPKAIVPTEGQDVAGESKEHDLKCSPAYFAEVKNGRKTFELRRDDRGYAVGDTLRLREWWAGRHTGDEVKRRVTCVMRGSPFLADGYVVMGIEPIETMTLRTRTAELEAALDACAVRLRDDGDLFHDQGNEQRARASWEYAARGLALTRGW